MSKTGSRVVGVISIVLSICSIAAAVYYMVGTYRPLHALMFAAIFVVLLVYGIVAVRAKGKSTASA